MNQNGAYLYLTNGTDNIVRYDGTTTLQTYTALATPAAPTVAETGLAGTGNNFYYKVSAVNQVGFSIASAASTAACRLSVPFGRAAVPVAVAANSFRIISTGLMVQYWDPDKAEGTPIGVNCRLCERENCSQRAEPPITRTLILDENTRRVSSRRLI